MRHFFKTSPMYDVGAHGVRPAPVVFIRPDAALTGVADLVQGPWNKSPS